MEENWRISICNANPRIVNPVRGGYLPKCDIWHIIRNENGTPILVSWGFIRLGWHWILFNWWSWSQSGPCGFRQIGPGTSHYMAPEMMISGKYSLQLKYQEWEDVRNGECDHFVWSRNHKIIQRFASWKSPCRTVVFQPRDTSKTLKYRATRPSRGHVVPGCSLHPFHTSFSRNLDLAKLQMLQMLRASFTRCVSIFHVLPSGKLT